MNLQWESRNRRLLFLGAANELFLLADGIKNKTLDELIEEKEKNYQHLIENDALNNPIKNFKLADRSRNWHHKSDAVT